MVCGQLKPYLHPITKKGKKGKSQKGINLGDKPNEFIGSVRTWTSHLPTRLLELPIVLKLKDNKTENSSGKMQRLQMNLP